MKIIQNKAGQVNTCPALFDGYRLFKITVINDKIKGYIIC
jgi:hypothetical protein